MGGLSPISPSAAANQTQVLPAALQSGAQNNAFGNIQNLSSSTYPGLATGLTQQQVFNPYATTAMQGANAAAGYGGQAAANQFGVGGSLETLGQQVSGAGYPLIGYGNQVMQTAFDPQQALYQRTLQQEQQQMQAMNAQSGVGSTPYAAGLNAQNLQNFNISWQAQQLANQVSGLNAASGAYGTAAGMAQTGAGITQAGAQLQAGAPALALQSAMYPYLTSEQISQTGMGALGGLQQYAMTPQQQQINDYLSLLGLVPQQQQAVTNSALAQNQIQNTGFSQLMALLGGAGGGIGAIGSGVQGKGPLGFLPGVGTSLFG